MSTFGGKLLETSLDFIRIDDFQTRNFDGSAFFLSHFHSDHMRGLYSSEFIKLLVEDDNKMLYCSMFTKYMVLSKDRCCKIPMEKICAIEVNSTLVVQHNNRESVQVTAIPAGHCPGSVMFLFEQGKTCILYTGDFRIHPNDVKKIKALHDRSGMVKKIDTLYLDTTFCHTKYLTFPSRNQSLEDIVDLIASWLNEDCLNEVGIRYNSYHGLEPILILISQRIKERIWIADERSYANYAVIPELHDMLTSEKLSAKIHLCPVSSQGECQRCLRTGKFIKTIKPCAMSFNLQQLQKSRVKEDCNVVRVAYATHCSLEELIKIVSYLKPENTYPCVVPNNTSHEQVLENLQLSVLKLQTDEKENLLSCANESSDQESTSSSSWFQPTKMSYLSKLQTSNLSTTNSSDDSLSPITPPAKRRCSSQVNEAVGCSSVQSQVQDLTINETDSSDSIEVIEEPLSQGDTIEDDSPPL
ncbi:protein artemis-like [Homalodisca vitripennis]|uniref:protein artemis-like n=1 Tax=Homalodisca vitripennis TaxID=197043 RepID=UPI001EEA562D|nr:protein artemis-like [Homalodisca vitripennis]